MAGSGIGVMLLAIPAKQPENEIAAKRSEARGGLEGIEHTVAGALAGLYRSPIIEFDREALRGAQRGGTIGRRAMVRSLR